MQAKKAVESVSGYCFVYWGLANLVTFLVFQFMLDTEDKRSAFNEYFAFDGGNTNLFQPFRAIIASNRLENLIASAPSLLIGGYYLQKQIGGKRTFKYWQVSLLSCFICLWALGPHMETFEYNYREYFFIRWDGIMEETKSMLAPELLGSCCLYMLAAVNKYYYTIYVFLLLDFAYYGAIASVWPLALFIQFKVIKN